MNFPSERDDVVPAHPQIASSTRQIILVLTVTDLHSNQNDQEVQNKRAGVLRVYVTTRFLV